MMNRLWLALVLAILGSAPAQAQRVQPPFNVAPCAYNLTPPTLTDGWAAWPQCDATGNLRITGSVTATVTPTNPIGITPTDRTVASATGASQVMAAALATRRGLIVQNTGTANCGVNPTGGTAAIGSAGTLTLVPGGSYQPRIPTLSAVTVICTAGQPIYGEEN